MKYELTKEDVELVNKALDSLKAGYGIMAIISDPQKMAIAQRVEQIKQKLQPNEDEATN